MYDESIKNPDKFWETQAKAFLDWMTPFKVVTECVKEKGTVKWFTGGQLNVSSKLLWCYDGSYSCCLFCIKIVEHMQVEGTQPLYSSGFCPR